MAETQTQPRPLRLGIMIDRELGLEQWEFELVERLVRHPKISLEAIVDCGGCARFDRPGAALRAVLAAEKKLLGMASLEGPRGCGDVLGSIPQISLPEFKALSERPDLLLSLVPGLPDAIIDEADCEIWEFDFNAGPQPMPGAFGFRETLEQAPVTRTAILSRMPSGTVKRIGECATGTKFSAAFTALFAKSILPVFAERELVRRRIATTHGQGNSAAPSLEPGLASENPTASQVGRYVLQLLKRVSARIFAAASRKFGGNPGSWSLLVGKGNALDCPLGRLVELRQPGDQFRADPFLFEKDGETFVFFESCLYREGQGKICVGRIDGDNLVDVSEIALGDCHLSYPFVFAHGEDIFMIPETHQSKRVEVWKCTDFPSRWTLHATALEGSSPADTVLLQNNGAWWLLTNLSTGSVVEHCMELHAFKVDGPGLGSVEPHPLNPVVLDTTSARNAGRPFVKGGRLIRPAQINSHGTYGYGLRLMEITELSMNEFSEREIRRIEPDQSSATIGCHHLDVQGDMFILDARRAFGSRLWGARPIALRAS